MNSNGDKTLVSAFAVYKTLQKSNPSNKKRKSSLTQDLQFKKIKKMKPTIVSKKPNGSLHTNKMKETKNGAKGGVKSIKSSSTSIRTPEQKKSNKKKKKRQSQQKEAIKTTNSKSVPTNGINIDDEEPPKLIPIITTPSKSEVKQRLQIVDEDLRSSTDDDPLTESQRLFKWLLSPISPETFFQNNWEKESLHIKRNKPKYYSHILDSSRLDKMLRDNPLYYTRNVNVVAYEKGVKEIFNQEGRAVPSALWDFYANGCSIQVLNPQTYNHKVHLLIATLQEYFGTMVGANVYLTPPNSQGFAPHFDDIEAFIVQLEGRKHWKLYYPKHSDVLARNSSGNFNRDDLGEPFMKLTLEAGDILYFPRGTIHEGSTDEDAHSLHITVSVYQHTAYIDLLEKLVPDALRQAAENDLEFRRGLPLNFLKHIGVVNAQKKSKERTEITTITKRLLQSLLQYLDIDKAADQLGRKFMYDSMPPVPSRTEVERSSKGDGDYLKDGQVMNRIEIGLETKIRLLRYHCIRVVMDSPPKLYYNTENANIYHGEEEQWLELEPKMVRVIKLLQNVFPKFVEVESLPIDDAAIKLQLVSDLWEHGLLVTDHPLPTFDENDETE